MVPVSCNFHYVLERFHFTQWSFLIAFIYQECVLVVQKMELHYWLRQKKKKNDCIQTEHLKWEPNYLFATTSNSRF